MGYPVFALSYPNPSGSYVAQNALRQKFGFNIKPVSVRSLKEAMKVLRQGGTVMTAVDRPGLGGEPFQFFGRSAILPVGYARLAVKTNSPIMVGIPHLGEDGVYTAECADFLEPPLMGSEAEKSHTLAQKVLDAFEVRIREEPERWLMFYPVWPEVIPSAQT
jgi:lauroyl/myristoyl acyltransferase